MAFNNSTNKIATKRLIKKFDAKLSGRANTNDGKIDRVLEGQGRVSVSACERVGDSFQVSGTVNADLFYLNTEKQLSCESIVLDFNEKVRVTAIDEAFVLPRVKSIKLSKESDSQIAVSVIVEFELFGVVYEEVEFVCGADEGCYTIEREVELSQLVASTNTNFSLTTPLEIADLTNVLSANVTTSVSNVIAHQNYAELEGSCVVDIWYQENEQLKKTQKNVDFSEEIPLLNCQDGLVIDFAFYDRAVNVMREEKVIDINIGVALWAMEAYKVKVIEDAFSEREVLDFTIAEFDNINVEPVRNFSERKTVIVDTTNRKRVDEILFMGAVRAETDHATYSDVGVNIEGVITFPIIYKNYDNDDIISTILSAPFEIAVSTDIRDEHDIESFVCAEVCARVNSYKNKAGKEISMVVDFDGQVYCQTLKKEHYIERIEKKEQIMRKKSSIVVYRPNKNESVFNIAKELKISPDVLRAQNPQLEDGNECEQVVVYTKF